MCDVVLLQLHSVEFITIWNHYDKVFQQFDHILIYTFNALVVMFSINFHGAIVKYDGE